MKISNTVLILVIAMTNIVSTEAKGDEGGPPSNPGSKDACIKACTDTQTTCQETCNVDNLDNCYDTCAKNWETCFNKAANRACNDPSRRALASDYHRRALASDEQVLWGPEFDDCWEETYENALYADTKHLFVLAVPKNKDSNCPSIALDNGFSGGEGHGWSLAPMLTISDTVPEGVLFLGHTVTLKSFSDAINQLSPANYAISEYEYNIVENNCATLLLDLFTKVGLDYKDPNTATKIENYVGKSLAANDVRVGEIRQAYLERNQGIFHKASFYVWNFAVGDEGMTRALVRSYMNKIVEE